MHELCHINLYMNIGISNLHNWSSDPKEMNNFTSFHSLHDYWFPKISKPLEHTSWGNCSDVKNVLFSSPKCEKMKIKWNIKTRCVTEFNWQLGLRVWSIIHVITRWAHKRQTFTLISIKLLWIYIFLFTDNRVFKHKGVVSNLHVCCNGLVKMWGSYIFHFFTKNYNLHTYEIFNIFLHNICRDAQHSLFRSRKYQNDLPNT